MSDVRQGGRPDGQDGNLAGGTLGVAHLVFMVMAAVAPAGGVVAILPLAIALGVGQGTPGIFVVVAVILLLFAVGFTRMVPYVRNAGAFYAFIARGLGRPAGLPAAFVALTAYLSIGSATVGAFSFFASLSLNDFFGISVPWWLCGLAALVVMAVLGYLRITLAAGVLGVALVTEAAVVLVLDVAILIHQGPGAFLLGSFAPSAVFGGGAIGVGLIYGFSCFQGFEGTAIYAEEARDPDRTVPRATYAAIVCVGLFFVLTSWALLAAAGPDAPAVALADPGTFAYKLSDTFVGTAWTRVLQVLIVTSCFAGALAFHNAASRYLFALARDGFLPAPLARTHHKYRSPAVAGGVSFVVMTVIIVGFALAGLDPLTNLSTALTGLGAVGLLALITCTSLAVVVFFLRRREFGWRHTVAPVLATVGMAVATGLALVNYGAITGTDNALINSLPWLHLVVIVVAVALALWARAKDRRRYEAMGRTRIAE